MEAVCCIDMGTTRIKVGLVDDHGRVLCSATAPSPDFYPWNAFLAFDVRDYEVRVFQAVREAREGTGRPELRIAAVAVTSQRATFLVLGPDGRPATPAISWQDTSSHAVMNDWVRRFGRDRFTAITGLPPSALWTLSKILRLGRIHEGRPPVPGTRFVLLHDYMLHRLGAQRWVTDPSNASVTGLMDVSVKAWSPPVLEACGLAESHLPEIVSASSPAGAVSAEASRRTGLLEGTPLLVGGGDQQCAALGSGTLTPSEAALCLGSAAVLSCPLDRPAAALHGDFFCTAHAAEGLWLLEGIHNAFSTTIRWTSEMLGCETPEAFERLAGSAAPGAAGVLFLPFLAGIGSPDFDARATGTLLGLRQGHTRGELARAALEGVCLELRRILDAAERYTGPRRLLVSGGGLPGPYSREILARILCRETVEIENPHTSLTGAAMLAWKGAGRFETLEAAVAALSGTARGPVHPAPRGREYAEVYERYCAAVGTALGVWHGAGAGTTASRE